MRARFVIFVFILLALLLNLADIGQFPPVSTMKSAVLSTLYPLQWFSNATVGGTKNFFSFIFSSHTIKQINKELRKENDLLKIELMPLNTLREENEILRKTLSFSPPQYKKMIPAEIVGRPRDLWNSYFIIDCGKFEGVKKGATVIVPDGLVGKIIEVGPLTSKVRLILEIKSAVTIKTVKTRIEALAVGDGSSLIKLKYVPAGSGILIGEEVAVSPSSKFFPGVPVGHISKISGSEMDLFKNIEVTPSVDFSKQEVVYVVLE